MRSSKNTLLFAASILVLSLSALAWRADATSTRPPAQPTAIATVDIVAVIDGLKEREVLEESLNVRTNARQEQLTEVVNQIKVLQQNIEESGDRTTDSYKEQVRQMMELRAVAKARSEALNQIVSIDLGTVRREMYNKVAEAINAIADREGYDLVLLDDSKFPLPENALDQDVYRAIITKSVMFRHDTIDITTDIITLMNNEFSAP